MASPFGDRFRFEERLGIHMEITGWPVRLRWPEWFRRMEWQSKARKASVNHSRISRRSLIPWGRDWHENRSHRMADPPLDLSGDTQRRFPGARDGGRLF